MNKVLISACLAGKNVRYDGKSSGEIKPAIKKLIDEGKAILICPEMDAGLKAPRACCEIIGGDGKDVLKGAAKVMNTENEDITDYFIIGAKLTKELAKKEGIRKAILKEQSPSCGTKRIYDGTFSGNKVPGAGVTAAILNTIECETISDEDI